jgi:IS5 family transposase
LTELDDINELMDWEAIEHLLGDIHAKRRGNSAWPPVFMFKALLLQSWYSLSDPKLERLLVRDLLFGRFVGLLSGKESEIYADSAYKSKKRII